MIKYSLRGTIPYDISLICFAFLLLCSCRIAFLTKKPIRYWDAHGHLSFFEKDALDSLTNYGIYGVRDCGGDLVKLKSIRDSIGNGKMKGPKLILSGPFIDGAKKGPYRIAIISPEQGARVVDSLIDLGVDFIKTHNGISKENYFAVIQRAREKGMKIVSHVPKGVPIWEAANAGVTCFEHIAESVLASPIYAGFAKTPEEAGNWWLHSPVADSIIKILSSKKVFITPTLIAFKIVILDAAQEGLQKQDLKSGFDVLKKITLKLHKSGIKLLAGSDFARTESGVLPGSSLFKEIDLLKEAGLSRREAKAAATVNFELWLKSK